MKAALCHAQGNLISRLLKPGLVRNDRVNDVVIFYISALPIAKLLASQTTLKGLAASGNAKTGASTRDCFTDV